VKNYQYILTHSSGNLTTEYNPIQWAELNIVFTRSKVYHSVLRNQILDLEFPRDGKAYIDSIYETYGIDTDIGCEIKELNKLTQAYTTLFTGIIDLTEWLKMRDTTTVKVIDSSVMAKFQARDEIKVPINRLEDLDGGTMAVYTYLSQMTVTGVQIELLAKWDDLTNTIPVTAAETTTFSNFFGVTGNPYDINDIGTDATLPAKTLGSFSGPLYTNNSGGSLDVRYRVITGVTGTIDVTIAGGGTGWTYTLNVHTGVNGGTTTLFKTKTGTGADSDSVDEDFDSGYVTVTVPAGQTIDIIHGWNGSLTGPVTVTPNLNFEPVSIEVYEITAPQADSDINMPLLHELGAKLLEIMTGKTNPLNAPLLGRTDSAPRTYGSDGDYSLTGVASGNMLREFSFSNKPLTTSFRDYFKSLDALFNMGMWYNGTEFSIAAKADFYKVSNIITLGEVKDLEVSIATEEYFNSIKCGYQEPLDYEDVNGNQNFNVPTEFANDGKRINNALDIQSIYHGDDYGIELARKYRTSKVSSEDAKTDEQIFFLWGKRDSGDYKTVPGSDFAEVIGVYSPDTRLNLNITPKRNLIRHYNRLGIPLFKSQGDTNFMTNQYELDLVTEETLEPFITEKADIAYSELYQELYYPEIYNFSAPLTQAHIQQLFTDPHGYVEFDYIGVTYSGYILEVSTEPFMRRGNWTLIKRNPNRV
jgi:hypothetical protein